MRKKIIKIVSGVLIFTSLFLKLDAQDAKHEIININKAFNETEKYEVDVLFNTYIDGKKDKPSKSTKCKIAKNGKKYYYSQLNSEMIVSEKYSVNIDHYNKIIIISGVNKSSKGKTSQPSSWTILDSIFTAYKTVVVEKINDNKNKITFTLKTGALSKCEVVYDPKSYLIESVCSYYSKPVELEDKKKHSVSGEMVYTNFSTTIKNEGRYFNTSSVFIEKDKKIILTPKYGDYQLINN